MGSFKMGCICSISQIIDEEEFQRQNETSSGKSKLIKKSNRSPAEVIEERRNTLIERRQRTSVLKSTLQEEAVLENVCESAGVELPKPCKRMSTSDKNRFIARVSEKRQVQPARVSAFRAPPAPRVSVDSRLNSITVSKRNSAFDRMGNNTQTTELTEVLRNIVRSSDGKKDQKRKSSLSTQSL